MLAMPSTSSMAMIGRDATSRCAKIALLVHLAVVASVVAVASEAVAASAAASAVVEALAVAEGSVVVLEAVEDLVEEVEEVEEVATEARLVAVQASREAPPLKPRTHSPTLLRLEGSLVTPSTSGTFRGLPATRTSSSSSLLLERLSAPRFNTSPMAALVALVLSSSRRLAMPKQQSVSLA